MISFQAKGINYAFYHVPKTGGLLIKDVLRKKGIQHTIIGNQHARPQDSPKKLRQKSICIHRKPSEWLKSYWSWKTQAGKGSKDDIWQPCEPHINYHPTWQIDKSGDMDYNQFLINMKEQNPLFHRRLWTDYRCDINWRFESLEMFFNNVLGLQLPAVKVNDSIHPEIGRIPHSVKIWLSFIDSEYDRNQNFYPIP